MPLTADEFYKLCKSIFYMESFGRCGDAWLVDKTTVVDVLSDYCPAGSARLYPTSDSTFKLEFKPNENKGR